ncbi:hypothetical protein [Cellulomonas sp. ATA003]|uniref:hypothetical protein n=1 Tax=Cellulomonas sp. ATA003 TaxID=3073064 RepID=UPI0028735D20|nr:hypothetical protein [Cellulomonas sp. ATA003]WNB84792.1 hypothetical protein REH70_13640 [Cellulomonas sp. ATA003]
MTAWDRTETPVAFSGTRLGWQDLPRPVRARIADRVGAEVIAETGATSGFSPGFASVLELGDGREVFVKAVSAEQNPHSPSWPAARSPSPPPCRTTCRRPACCGRTTTARGSCSGSRRCTGARRCCRGGRTTWCACWRQSTRWPRSPPRPRTAWSR